MRQARLASAALVMTTAVWGLTFPLIRSAVQIIPPLTFVAIRFLLAATILGLVLAFATRTRITPKELKVGAWLGLLLFLACGFQTLGLRWTSAGNAGFITGLSVVLVPLLLLVFSRRRPRATLPWNIAIGLALAVAGLWCLCSNGSTGNTRGDLLVLLCSVASAGHIIAVSRYSSDLDPIRVTWVQVTVCGLLAVAASAASGERSLEALHVELMHRNVVIALLFCAVFATAGGFLTQILFQQHTTPTKAALIFSCEPVFAAGFAYLVAGEHFHQTQWLGAALLLAGMLCSELFVVDPASV